MSTLEKKIDGDLYVDGSVYGFKFLGNDAAATPAYVARVLGQAADGAAAYGVKIGNVNALSTAGAKIVGFYSDNLSTEKAYIDKDGSLTTAGYVKSTTVLANAFSHDVTCDQETYSSVYANQTAATLQNGSAYTGVDYTMATKYVAVKFVASGNHEMRSFACRVKCSVALTNPTQVLTGALYADDGTGTNPGALISTSATSVSFGSLTAAYQVAQFLRSTALVAGTTYWFVIYYTAAPTGGNIIFDAGNAVGFGASSADALVWVPDTNALYFKVYGRTYRGVMGISTNAFGVYGISTNNFGVYGSSTNNIAVIGASTNNYGVYGSSPNNAGVYGSSTNNYGVRGISTNGIGLYASSTNGYGAYAGSVGSIGLYAVSTNSYGVFGTSTTSYSGYFTRNSSTAITPTFYVYQDHATDANTVLRVRGDSTGALQDWLASTTQVAALLPTGSLIQGAATAVGANGTYVHALQNGVAPTTSPADMFQTWAADRAAIAGKSSLHWRAEDGTVGVIGDYSGFGTATPAYRVDVNGDINITEGQYYRYGTGILAYAQTALDNYYFGPAGNLTTTGIRNTAVGEVSLATLGVGATGNTALGYASGYSSTTGVYNVFIGYQAGLGSAGAYAGADYNVCIGFRTGYDLAGDSNYNVLVGASSGENITTGDHNVLIGYAAGQTFTTVDSSVAIGSLALVYTTGGENTALGYRSGYYNRTGQGNTFVGIDSGYGVGGAEYDGSNYNVAVGQRSLYTLQGTSTGNVAVGRQAGNGFTTSDVENVFVGYQAGYGAAGAVSGTNYNVGVGSTSLYSIASAALGNTALGYRSGYNSSTGTYNTLLGYEAGYGSGGVYTGADYNVAVGYRAGYALSNDANYNTLVGSSAGVALTTGDYNVLVGASSGAAYTGDYATAVGFNALIQATGVENTALGAAAGYSCTTGTYNTFVGRQAGYGIGGVYAGSNENVGVGYKSLYSLGAAALGNTALGVYSGYSSTTGDYNTFLGFNAGYYSTTNGHNTFVGEDAGKGTGAYIDSQYNVAVGYRALSSIAPGGGGTANSNVAVGSSAGAGFLGDYLTALGAASLQLTTGTGNTAAGYMAGYACRTGANNVFVGQEAGRGLAGAYDSSDNNVVIGYQAEYRILGAADGNTVIGYQAGYYNGTGTNNVFVGIDAGKGSADYTGSNHNVAVGYRAGYVLGTNSSYNVLIGPSAGVALATGNLCTCVGAGAGAAFTGDGITAVGRSALSSATGVGNTALGLSAGDNSSDGTYNTFVGMEAGAGSGGVYTGADYNVALGYRSMYDIDNSALNNTCLGALSGENITTGDGNVCLGYQAGSAITTANNQLYIANSNAGAGSLLITGDFSDGSVGIGIAPGSLTSWLHIKAGTATAGEGPLKFTNAATYLGTIEEGSMEASYYHLWYSPMAAVREGLVGTVFAQTADVTVANTAAATTLMGAGRGLDLDGTGFPANFFALAGKTVRLRAWGYLSSTANATMKFFVTILTGGGTGITLETDDIDVASRTEQAWSVEADITYRAGATPKACGQGRAFTHKDAVTADIAEMVELTETTVDPTAVNFMDLKADWNSANVLNTITCTNLTVEVLD